MGIKSIAAVQRLKQTAASPFKFGSWVGEKNHYNASTDSDDSALVLNKSMWKSTTVTAPAEVYVALNEDMKVILHIGDDTYQLTYGSPQGLAEGYNAMRRDSKGLALPSIEAIVWLFTGKAY